MLGIPPQFGSVYKVTELKLEGRKAPTPFVQLLKEEKKTLKKDGSIQSWKAFVLDNWVYPAFPQNHLPDKLDFWESDEFIGKNKYIATFMVEKGKNAGFYIAVDDKGGNDASELHKLILNYEKLTKGYLIKLADSLGVTLTEDEKTHKEAMSKPTFEKAVGQINDLGTMRAYIMNFIAGYASTKNGDLMSDLYLAFTPPWFWEKHMAPFISKATPLLEYLEKTLPKK